MSIAKRDFHNQSKTIMKIDTFNSITKSMYMSAGDWKDMFKGVQENDIELVEYYLRIGIDPNHQHPEFMTLPLAESIRYNHLEVAKELLENGARPMEKEWESGRTCLEIAVELKNQSAINLLTKYLKS